MNRGGHGRESKGDGTGGAARGEGEKSPRGRRGKNNTRSIKET